MKEVYCDMTSMPVNVIILSYDSKKKEKKNNKKKKIKTNHTSNIYYHNKTVLK